MGVYKWKTACHINGDAQVAGEICEQLEKNGKLTPSELVEVSRSEDAPLHSMFTWDDGVAAEKWRQQEAGHIIRCLVTVVNAPENVEPVRAFVSIVHDDEKPKYEHIGRVLQTASSKQILLDSAKKEMLMFVRKYEQLTELSSVIDAMNSIIGSQAKLKLTT